MPHLLIAAAHKSSGKTTLSVGLCAALAARGRQVQPFKKGPDYIDPLWLARAAGRPCYNLDFHTMAPEDVAATFARHARNADLALIEANKGLFDGVDLLGTDSNAALAKLLGAPVVLVIDATGMTRGIAPLLLGYLAFDPGVRIAGVILNQVGGPRHERKLREVIEHYTPLPVLGAVQRDARLAIEERHLGLIPSNEAAAADDKIAIIAGRVAEQVDLDRLLSLAATAGQWPQPAHIAPASPAGPGLRIGIVRDSAFAFYYQDDLEALELAGAALVPIDSLHDARLPELDGLFIGGGFPETHMRALEANTALRAAIRAAIEQGLPTYAECGGLMYLSRSLSWRGQRCEMVGVIPGDTLMRERPQGRGYVRLQETAAFPWPQLDARTGEVAAHEFHYSALENLTEPVAYAYRVARGHGVDGQHDGIVHKNLLASYAHLRHGPCNPWTARFLAFVQERRRGAGAPLRSIARA